VSNLTHSLQLNCLAPTNPIAGTALASITLATKSGGTLAASTAVEQLWGFVRPFFSSATTVVGATLWKYVANSYEKNFISAYSGNLAAGSNAAALNPAHQSILSFRSGNGGIMYVNLVDDATTGLTRTSNPPNAAGGIAPQLANYMLGANSCWLARDNGFPIASLNYLGGQNEAIFKRRNRQ
jgi:hypothetical protein